MRALFDTYGAMLGHAILVHTGYVLICVTVGFFLGLLLGVALSRMPRTLENLYGTNGNH